MPSGRPAKVPHQGAVLGVLWSDLDDVKLVLGLLDVYVKVLFLRGVLTAMLANLMMHSHHYCFFTFEAPCTWWSSARRRQMYLLWQTITMYALHEMYMMIYDPSVHLTMRSIALVDIWRRHADDYHVQGASKVSWTGARTMAFLCLFWGRPSPCMHCMRCK